MRIKITHPIQTDYDFLQAGTIHEVETEQAREWIDKGWAIEFEDGGHFSAKKTYIPEKSSPQKGKVNDDHR